MPDPVPQNDSQNPLDHHDLRVAPATPTISATPSLLNELTRPVNLKEINAEDLDPISEFGKTLDKITSSIENYTQEGRKQHPVLARLGDATKAAKDFLVGGTTPKGPQSGVLNNPVTALMSFGDAAPEAGATLEKGVKAIGDYITDRRAFFPNPEAGKVSLNPLAHHDLRIAPVEQGGHAGGGVASEEELARPGRFVKVSKGGQLTDQGKTPDFNLKPGEAGYQVTEKGPELKAGVETPATKKGVEDYHKEVFPPKKEETPVTPWMKKASKDATDGFSVNPGTGEAPKEGKIISILPEKEVNLGQRTARAARGKTGTEDLGKREK